MRDRDQVLINIETGGPILSLVKVNVYFGGREIKILCIFKQKNDFRNLLERTRTSLPEVRLVICQPFILTETSAVDASWVEPFAAYQEIAFTIAGEFGATWVPFQEAFDNALSTAPAVYWAADGVHPSMAGAALMANTWLNALK